ncbi:hypothetical protein CVT24_003128 [Panaeolus cyanescens]|uniref:Uncharacterized protein n=1 Tax=Panaeolus cyanescens TaxID=181874 RepID=A0A409W1U5_9AGAR|nr:hypothetical protein CVT24_003128 [Panaeolus cyanescens]
MSNNTSSKFNPPGLFEPQPNNAPVPGKPSQRLPVGHDQTQQPDTSNLGGSKTPSGTDALEPVPIVPLSAPLTSAARPGTLVGGGTLQAGETSTLNQLAGAQPIESDTQKGSVPGSLPRTPLFPGAYPTKESPLHYPPISAIPGMAMNTLQTVNETIQAVGDKVGEYVPETVSSYFPHSRQTSTDQTEDSASAPTGTMVPDWPREAAKLDKAPAPSNVPNLHPGAKGALDDAEYVHDKDISEAYSNDIANTKNLHEANATTANAGQSSGGMVASNAAYVKDKTMGAVHAVEEAIGSAGSAVAHSLPAGAAAYLPHSESSTTGTTTNPAVSAKSSGVSDQTGPSPLQTGSGTAAYLGSITNHPSNGTTKTDATSNYASTEASTRTLHGSVETPSTADSESTTVGAFNHEGPHPAPAKLPSFLAGQPLDENVQLSKEPDMQKKPLAGALDHQETPPTEVASPNWNKTAVYPPDVDAQGQSATNMLKAPSPSNSRGGVSSTTATPGHEVPAANISRISTHPPSGLSSNKTADVAESSGIPPLTKPSGQPDAGTTLGKGKGNSADVKPLPDAPQHPAGVLNGGGEEVRKAANAEGVEIVPAVPGEHGHVRYAREVKEGGVEPSNRGDGGDVAKDGRSKLTKPKPADVALGPTSAMTAASTGTGTAPAGNAGAGALKPQTTPSKLTKTPHAEREVTHRNADNFGDKHLDPNSHISSPSVKKPGLMDKIKGEIKIVSGKLGGKEEKVEEGRRMMGKIHN